MRENLTFNIIKFLFVVWKLFKDFEKGGRAPWAPSLNPPLVLSAYCDTERIFPFQKEYLSKIKFSFLQEFRSNLRDLHSQATNHTPHIKHSQVSWYVLCEHFNLISARFFLDFLVFSHLPDLVQILTQFSKIPPWSQHELILISTRLSRFTMI